MIEIRHSWAYKIFKDWNQQSTVCDTARHQNTSPLHSHFDVYKWYAAVPCLYSRNFKLWKLLVHGIQQKQPKSSWCPISISQTCNYLSHFHVRKKSFISAYINLFYQGVVPDLQHNGTYLTKMGVSWPLRLKVICSTHIAQIWIAFSHSHKARTLLSGAWSLTSTSGESILTTWAEQ